MPAVDDVNSPAETLALALKRSGSDRAFGVPGGGPNLDVVGALDRHGIDFVLAHSETSSCIMASVYGLLTGQVSTAVVTRGPGAAAAVNGAAQATLDRHPLLLVTDTVPSASAGRVPHQRLDQRAMFEPVCKRSKTLGHETTVDHLVELIDCATSSPRGTVHLDYDTTAPGDDRGPDTATDSRASTAGRPGLSAACGDAADGLDQAASLLSGAERPVVIVGLDVSSDSTHIARLRGALELLGAPVLSTYQAIGVIPTEHRLAAGLFTNGASERPLLNQADLIVTIGLDVVEPIPAPWTYRAPVLSLARTMTEDPYLPIEVALVGEPSDLAESLFVSRSSWGPEAGADHRQSVRSDLLNGGALERGSPSIGALDSGALQSNAADALGPLEVVQIAAEAAPDDTLVTVDAGAHFLAIMPFWPVLQPHQLLISNGLATMGYAVPAAVAASLANRDRPVLCFVGDGGLGMTLAELETIARLELPVTVVVFNDSALSLIRIKQSSGNQGTDHGGPKAVSYRFTDFAALAPSLGVEGVAAETGAELSQALRSGWDRPRLIDARIDPGPYSHLIAVTRG